MKMERHTWPIVPSADASTLVQTFAMMRSAMRGALGPDMAPDLIALRRLVRDYAQSMRADGREITETIISLKRLIAGSEGAPVREFRPIAEQAVGWCIEEFYSDLAD